MKKLTWEHALVGILLIFLAFESFSIKKERASLEYNPTVTTYYTNGGIVKKPTKVWTGVMTPTTSNGFTIDISGAGFTNIRSYQIICVRNTADPMLVPNIAVKTITTSSVVVNITQGNPATVVILGINVLSGYPVVFASSPETMQLSVIVTGD